MLLWDSRVEAKKHLGAIALVIENHKRNSPFIIYKDAGCQSL
jgi:hypothetical protein